ncbi:MAG: outer membrane beta-barrel protein [Colwelliaceae bacterium]|jgi:opacity protein-like surface antigen|nr:outer membrane beta-barrel protein [Colwelliaceae bacterium]
MKLINFTSACSLLLIITTTVFAEDKKTAHSIGLQTGGGGLEHKGKDTDGQGVGHSYLYYNYQFMPNYYAEVGVLGGEDIDDWQCNDDINGKLECYTDNSNNFEFDTDNFDYGAITIALKSDLKLSKRNKLYAKVGAEFYDYQFKLDREKIIDENGVGLLLEAGWEYRWDSGIGLNTAMQYHDMGDLEMSSLNIGISYAF